MNEFNFLSDVGESAIVFQSNTKTFPERLCYILENNCPWIIITSADVPLTWQPELKLELLLRAFFNRQAFRPVRNVENPFVIGDKVQALRLGNELTITSISVQSGLCEVDKDFRHPIHFTRLVSTDPDFPAIAANTKKQQHHQ